MAINFLQIQQTKIPGVYTEVDTSQAFQGASLQRRRVLLIGQKRAGGAQAPNVIHSVTSAFDARRRYGAGSMLSNMAEAYFATNLQNSLSVLALDAPAGATAATGSLELSGTATEAGEVKVYIGGKLEARVAVSEAETAAAIVTKINSALSDSRYISSAVNGSNTSLLDFTSLNPGIGDNGLDVRTAYYSDDDLPAGITATATSLSGGGGAPDASAIVTAMGEEQYHDIVLPYQDTTLIAALEAELEARWGWDRQNDGQLYVSTRQAFSSHVSFLGNRNSAQLTVLNYQGPSPNYEVATELAGLVAQFAQQDPARPFTGRAFNYSLAPASDERPIRRERDEILNEGGSTFTVTPSGRMAVERLRTTRVQNSQGAQDEALSDLNAKLTISFLRFDFVQNHLRKFERHKLVDDSQRIQAGSGVLSPSIAKSEAVSRFIIWQNLGLVEGLAQFAEDLIVERDLQDPTRLNYRLKPNLANQLRVAGVQFQFLL